ncbi:hypothetical protein, partial [Streptomyces benahoarensis]|uniref:hypothetical protein n=1 Tax=Streptomyces benahoarensis TaxID=2595054 RepID=UPI001C8F21C4
MNATTKPAPTSRTTRAIISGSPAIPVCASEPVLPPAGAGLAGGAGDGGVEAGGEVGIGVG